MHIKTPLLSEVPIEMRDDVLYVQHTRIPIDTVLNAFKRGETAEQIVASYTTLALADTYAVIAYYLHHQVELDQYIVERNQRADALRQEIASRDPDAVNIRERLLARANKP